MADSNKLAEVVALLTERDQEYAAIERAATQSDEPTGEPLWSLHKLMATLEVANDRKIKDALNRAKVTAGKAELPIAEHFHDGLIFDLPGEVFLSKYAAYLVVMNCDPSEGQIGLAQSYFALQIDRQKLEDEKRIRTRLDVTEEQVKLSGAAKSCGVRDFQKFNGMGIQGLYGGLNVKQIKERKGLPSKSNHLDFAGSEELAANLFRITQTRAALNRQGVKSEGLACETHKTVGTRIRETIIASGNTPPEQLPAAELAVDRLATKTKRALRAGS